MNTHPPTQPSNQPVRNPLTVRTTLLLTFTFNWSWSFLSSHPPLPLYPRDPGGKKCRFGPDNKHNSITFPIFSWILCSHYILGDGILVVSSGFWYARGQFGFRRGLPKCVRPKCGQLSASKHLNVLTIENREVGDKIRRNSWCDQISGWRS